MFRMYESSRTKKSGRTSTNLYLQYKWDVLNYENHRYNVRTAKSQIDNGAPRTYPHLYYKPKKIQMELERFCEIQRENKLLMGRLAEIQRTGGWLDNKNFHEIKSLNNWKRQQEMIALAYNNQAMLSRLRDCRSQYNHHKLEDEYLLSRKHKANIEMFPKDWRKIKHQMNNIRKTLRAHVINTRTGKELRQKVKEDESLKDVKEALKAEKVETFSKIALEEEKSRLKLERLKALQERKLAAAERDKASEEWRKARDERLRLIKERKDQEQQKLDEAKEKELKTQKKRQEKIKKSLENWRQQKAESEAEKQNNKKMKRTRKKHQPSESRFENVFLEGGKKVVSMPKKEIEDFRAADKSAEVPTTPDEESPDTTLVAFEGGKKVSEVEEETVEDFRADPTQVVSDTTAEVPTKPDEDSKNTTPVVSKEGKKEAENEEAIAKEQATQEEPSDQEK